MSASEDADQALAQSFHAGEQHATELPPIAAAFLISFDLKVGYTISWQHSIDGLNLEGVVEFKSLPSGLHNIKEDIVYFVHEQYAGISAFVNRPAAESDRNAQFVAFGVLVPLSCGRLGRSWLYTQKLQELAREAAKNVKATKPLEDFWEEHESGKHDGPEQAEASAKASPTGSRRQENGTQPKSRRRGLSTVTAMDRPGRQLPTSHPILSLPTFIDLFGPLIYPLHRAALLRKRILLVAQPPVRTPCEFVYDISVLSTVSSALAEQLPPTADPYLRTTPLFIVGVHDIPFLSPQKKSATADADPDVSETGWIACTTDEILTVKKEIYDIVVELPNKNNKLKRWPTIKTSDDKVIKATQRDLRRWRALKRALSRSRPERYTDNDEAADDDERAGLLPSPQSAPDEQDDESYDDAVEPTSWGELARSGFMWWASAGERGTAADQEADQDTTLVGELEHLPPPPSTEEEQDDQPVLNYTPPKDDQNQTQGNDVTKEGQVEAEDVDATTHMELLAYFHRYSHQIFEGATHAIDGEGGDGDVEIGNDDLERMGLDSWSEQDRDFIIDLVEKYFGRRASVKGLGVECCGVRIC